jgi:chorismate-pyruvate lyase
MLDLKLGLTTELIKKHYGVVLSPLLLDQYVALLPIENLGEGEKWGLYRKVILENKNGVGYYGAQLYLALSPLNDQLRHQLLNLDKPLGELLQENGTVKKDLVRWDDRFTYNNNKFYCYTFVFYWKGISLALIDEFYPEQLIHCTWEENPKYQVKAETLNGLIVEKHFRY